MVQVTGTFMGLPIDGDIVASRRDDKPQLPFDLLQDAIAALLREDRIAGIKWTQYTPYFNDGDECIFSAGSLSILLAVDADRERTTEEIAESEDFANEDNKNWISDYGRAYEELVGGQIYTRDDTKQGYHYETVEGDPVLSPLITTLEKAIGGGQHNRELLKTFGDHCTVQIVKGRNVVEIFFYEHD